LLEMKCIYTCGLTSIEVKSENEQILHA
jgi:hypothetical protein